MKSLVRILTLAVILIAGSWILPPRVSAQEINVSIQLFYDQLSPHGTWVDYPNYGYVWIPDVDRGFSPYGTDGHWVFTVNGWTWISDYSWGWAPFHYGRWDYDNFYGWIWIPQSEWGPAWVTWRRSEGYYGWAPMGPGISIEFSFGSGYRVPNDRWIFVSDRYLTSPDINRYYVDRSTNVTIINNSTVINNTYIDNSRHTTYVAGPARDDVQKVTGTTIQPIAIRENDKPGQVLRDDQLQIYRPRVQTSVDNGRKPAPAKVVSLKEVKPISERKPGNQRKVENPPANDKGQPSQPPAVSPSKGKGQQPRVVNPPDKDKGVQEPSPPPAANPSDAKGRMQKPRVDNPPDKGKGTQEPPQPPAANPSDAKGRMQKPRVDSPPDINKKVDQPLKPTSDRSPKLKPPSPPVPKGKTRDAKLPKSKKEIEDSVKNREQNHRR